MRPKARIDEVAVARTVDFPIVGIGASAGGLEACKQLLHAVPADSGMALVVVQHLAPNQPSMLADILARSTELPVLEVKDEPAVQPNHVYVIPPGRNMAISSGRLRLLPREQAPPHRPIDTFFKSLAEELGHRAIGVILSGTGNDGTVGLEAIKAEGGFTFAQDRTAEHDAMPQSAIDSGCVDFVLPPWRIANELSELGRHPYVARTQELTEDLPIGSIERVLKILTNTTGVDFAHYKSTTLYRRIARRMLLHKLEGLNEYVKLLHREPGEVDALYHDVLINVTSFFRDPSAFDVLKERVFPRLVGARMRNDPIRLWVLGCSTGEEAYSLAIALHEFAEQHKRAFSAQIFATDLSDRGIEHARIGIYPKTIAQDVSELRLRRFFVESDSGYQIIKPIREMCVFARHNVLSDPPFSRMELISCRNVLIYMDPVLQRKVVPLLYYALNPGGCLWLGSSETIGNFSHLFEVANQKHRIYVKVAALNTGLTPSAAAGWVQPRETQPPRQRPAEVVRGTDAQREADRLALARYAPPGVLVNSDFEILQFRGDVGDYLAPAPGRPTNNVLKLARPGLMIGLRALLQKATRGGGNPVRQEGVRVQTNGGIREITVEILPVRAPRSAEKTFLVEFEDGRAAPDTEETEPDQQRKRAGRRSSRRADQAEREVARLTAELSATRDYLQTLIEQHEATNEELQSANEEVQSSNEELQSINEELQTSKEEIQSSNEELSTVNEELKNRNEELSQFNDDLTNFLASTHLALVMLSADLKIRRFTPQAGKILHLLPGDVGRSIIEIKPPFEFTNLKQALVEVIDTVTLDEREVQDDHDHWFSIRLRPYRTADNRIAGAVMVLVDIDPQKRAEQLLRDADSRKDEFLATLAHELRNPLTALTLGFDVMRRDESRRDQTLVAMERQVKKLLRLVEDLLDVSRIGRGKVKLRVETINLVTTIERAVESVRQQMIDRRHELSVSLPPQPLYMDADPVRVEQIVINLLSNAAKFTDPGGQISLELTELGVLDDDKRKEVMISVRDNGMGIEPETLPVIFDIFSQSGASSGRDQAGLGVGLYLVRRLVELHGGKVVARSAGVGRGTEFIVRMPLGSGGHFEHEDRHSEAPVTPLRSDVATRRILVIDDNVDAADTVAALYRMSGHEVQVAHNGPNGIEAAIQFRPSLILLDLAMPGMSGHEVARELRMRPELDDVVICAVSGYEETNSHRKSSESPFDAHLVKPPSLTALEELLDRKPSPAQARGFRARQKRSANQRPS